MENFQDSQLLIDTRQWKRSETRAADLPHPGILRRVLRVFGAALAAWSDSLHDLQMSSPAAVSARSHHSKPRS